MKQFLIVFLVGMMSMANAHPTKLSQGLVRDGNGNNNGGGDPHDSRCCNKGGNLVQGKPFVDNEGECNSQPGGFYWIPTSVSPKACYNESECCKAEKPLNAYVDCRAGAGKKRCNKIPGCNWKCDSGGGANCNSPSQWVVMNTFYTSHPAIYAQCKAQQLPVQNPEQGGTALCCVNLN